MDAYSRNIAVVGSALYGGILVIGFLVILLFEGGAGLYKRYSTRTSTFLVFSFLFTPTILFVGATVPWIGAVYGSPTAEIVLVVVPGCLLAFLLVAWFCLASNESLYNGDRYWMDSDDTLFASHVDGVDPAHDHHRRASALDSGARSLLAAPPLPLSAYNDALYLNSLHSRYSTSADVPPSRQWREGRSVESPLPAAWQSAPARTLVSSLASHPLEDRQRRQYIAAQLANAEVVAESAENAGPSGATIPTNFPPAAGAPLTPRASNSRGSLYVNTLPTAASSFRPGPPRQFPHTQAVGREDDGVPRTLHSRASPVGPAPPVIFPPVPLQETGRRGAAPSPHRHRLTRTELLSPPRGLATTESRKTAGAPIPRKASRPSMALTHTADSWEGASPQQIYLDVPFASELRD